VDAAAYAGFLRAIGHRVVSTASAHWYDASRVFFLSAPPNRVYEPAESEIRSVLRTRACFGVRYAAPLQGSGKLSYQIGCDNRGYGLEALSGNVRSKVRRGLKRCRVEALSFAVLASAGRQANADTVARQGREGVLSDQRWERFCSAAGQTPGFEAWSAWCGDELAAFLVTVTFDDCVEFLLARSCDRHLGAYPNNALIFTVAEDMLTRRGVPEITFGLESLEPVGPLDEFKFGMGFRQMPLRQRVVFHPVVQAVMRHRPVRAVFRRWSERHSGDGMFWRKAAGLLRFAEEGGF
jgi:GNAT acetyltransferase-like protein